MKNPRYATNEATMIHHPFEMPWTPITIPVAINTVNTRKKARAARPFTGTGVSDIGATDKVSHLSHLMPSQDSRIPNENLSA